jgi:hypothetical protein
MIALSGEPDANERANRAKESEALVVCGFKTDNHHDGVGSYSIG